MGGGSIGGMMGMADLYAESGDMKNDQSLTKPGNQSPNAGNSPRARSPRGGMGMPNMGAMMGGMAGGGSPRLSPRSLGKGKGRK
jgi:hypothetical protein